MKTLSDGVGPQTVCEYIDEDIILTVKYIEKFIFPRFWLITTHPLFCNCVSIDASVSLLFVFFVFFKFFVFILFFL